mgnify:FL=1|jgi:hypothetical protein|tara:strand:- start:1549 stop:1944 length:396 start_codon:yes stop_codon:yes gene_type:complete
MQKKILFLVFSFSIGASCFAQRNSSIGSIDVLADSRIQNLVALEKSIDEITGYRLQICFDSNKKVIDEARNRFLKLYPLIATYVEFEAPHFNLKVGDFRTRLEAEKVKRKVFGEFVICIIHQDLIQLPRID